MIMMKCGHAANATRRMPDGNDMPCCVICVCDAVDDIQPSLEGRTAQCVYCNNERPSSTDLPFFHHHIGAGHDTYYCGCRGWN